MERVTPARERGLFEFLAASRPQRGWVGSVAASAASALGHAAIIASAIAATLLTTRVASSGPPAMVEKLDIVDLVPPSTAFPAAAVAAAASAPDRTAAALRKLTPAPAEAERRERRLAALIPPTIVPEEIPLPNPEAAAGAMYASEYDGIGQDSTLTAAAIFADHHERTADDLENGPPQLTSYTQAPELANGDEMKKVLSRRYPPALKDEGVGGRVLIWFLVDEYGHARRWLLKESSGHRLLDRAAMLVAAQARFRPAMNYDRRVPVWVVLPVTFQVVDAS